MKKGGLEAGRGSGKESFRPGTENKKPLTEMSPKEVEFAGGRYRT